MAGECHAGCLLASPGKAINIFIGSGVYFRMHVTDTQARVALHEKIPQVQETTLHWSSSSHRDITVLCSQQPEP